jgi:hypothetical protein
LNVRHTSLYYFSFLIIHLSEYSLKVLFFTQTSFDESIGANMTVHNVVTNDVYADFPAMVALLMPGGYTSLLLGVDQEASAARKLHFDEAHKQ